MYRGIHVYEYLNITIWDQCSQICKLQSDYLNVGKLLFVVMIYIIVADFVQINSLSLTLLFSD